MVWLAQNGEISGHAGMHTGYVGLGNLRLDRHIVELGYFHDGGGGLIGVDGLALVGNDGDYGSGRG